MSKTSLVIFLVLTPISIILGLGGYYYLQQNQTPVNILIANLLTQPKSSIQTPLATEPLTKKSTGLTLNLSSPEEDKLVFESDLLLSGQTIADAEVILSTESEELVLELKEDGSFSHLVKLEPGLNNIIVVSLDQKGNLLQEKRTVFYSKEKL